jgi:hypothetical protein
MLVVLGSITRCPDFLRGLPPSVQKYAEKDLGSTLTVFFGILFLFFRLVVIVLSTCIIQVNSIVMRQTTEEL